MDADDVVVVVVGGTQFVTTRRTLQGSRRLATAATPMTLDDDPHVFADVLSCLRTGNRLLAPPRCGEARFVAAVRFYALDPEPPLRLLLRLGRWAPAMVLHVRAAMEAALGGGRAVTYASPATLAHDLEEDAPHIRMALDKTNCGPVWADVATDAELLALVTDVVDSEFPVAGLVVETVKQSFELQVHKITLSVQVRCVVAALPS